MGVGRKEIWRDFSNFFLFLEFRARLVVEMSSGYGIETLVWLKARVYKLNLLWYLTLMDNLREFSREDAAQTHPYTMVITGAVTG